MNAISTITSSTAYPKSSSSAATPAAPAALPAPAAAITLSAAAQKAVGTIQPQPDNVIWGS